MLRGMRSAERLEGKLFGLHVLVVDDNDDARDALVSALEFLGAEVTSTDSAAEARRALRSLRPDAILSDIAMPVEDGCTFIASVRAADDAIARTPAAAVTANSLPQQREHALTSGFSMVIVKPFDLIEIARAVLALCSR